MSVSFIVPELYSSGNVFNITAAVLPFTNIEDEMEEKQMFNNFRYCIFLSRTFKGHQVKCFPSKNKDNL